MTLLYPYDRACSKVFWRVPNLKLFFSLSGLSPLAQVAKNLRMGFEDIMQLLSRHVQSNTPDLWETACAWLLENEVTCLH